MHFTNNVFYGPYHNNDLYNGSFPTNNDSVNDIQAVEAAAELFQQKLLKDPQSYGFKYL